jgi:hypothetical protein
MMARSAVSNKTVGSFSFDLIFLEALFLGAITALHYLKKLKKSFKWSMMTRHKGD